MAKVEIIMPKLGESIIEATVLKWVKQVGDTIEVDETILEIATDKVDSEVPSPVSGTLAELRFEEGDVVPIGEVIAIVATEGEETATAASNGSSTKEKTATVSATPNAQEPVATTQTQAAPSDLKISKTGDSGRFYSPLVRSIAKEEQISMSELEQIAGSGMDGRVTKRDILGYIQDGRKSKASAQTVVSTAKPVSAAAPKASAPKNYGDNVEIIEMDRIRSVIADHMVNSKRTSPHVTSFVDVDVTNIWNWRSKVKAEFQKKYGQKITFTPIFIEAIAKALRDFPMINISLDGKNIIVKKDINIGMATALPNGNLIVPVIKNADLLNLVGVTKMVNTLADKARNNKLTPDDIQGGTFTMTNVGSYGDLFGTPIINQPQVGIMGTGAITKRPAVVETPYGDMVAVRYKMYLCMAYDHRVVDGFLGGSFANKVKYYLENFDDTQTI